MYSNAFFFPRNCMYVPALTNYTNIIHFAYSTSLLYISEEKAELKLSYLKWCSQCTHIHTYVFKYKWHNWLADLATQM